MASAGSWCCANSRLGRFAAVALFLSWVASAQLTTGTVEGSLRSSDGQPAANASVVITGGAGFRREIHTSGTGTFAVTLPYGNYQFGGAAVWVEPLQTIRVELVAGASGEIREEAPPGIWTDATRARVYPEAHSLQGILLSREPASVTEPLDFLGLSDNRLALDSQRGLSWTETQFRLQGIDATDGYQPGVPAILPNVEALDAIVLRSGAAQPAAMDRSPEVGLFLTEPGTSWHATLTSSDTGAGLSSTNLPPPGVRGLVQQPDRFDWFTRDGLDVGGPIANWADIFLSAAGQWSSQAVPLASPGTDQRSRLLFANARGRIRLSPRDQLEGEYVGSRIDLSDWGSPMGLETLEGNRMAPSFVLPGGFAGESEVDHLDFFQAGWTREFSEASGLGVLQVRYGYSTAHLDGEQTGQGTGPSQSRIDLLDGVVTGAPPLQNFAIRTRHSLVAAWQPVLARTGPIRHHLVAGGEIKTTSPRNRFSAPSNMSLITAAAAPTFVLEFNTPADSEETVRSFSGYAADQLTLAPGLQANVGFVADFSRGSVAGQPGTPISWNSVSPRVGLAWQVPRARGLVLRASYSRSYAPVAGRALDFGDPNALSGSQYQWIDRNGDGVFQPGEQGPLLLRFGGLYSAIAPSLRRPYSDEFDVGADVRLPRRLFGGIRFFRRDDKDRLATEDVGVPASAFAPVAMVDPGPDGIPGTFDDQPLTVYQQNPSTFGQDRYLLTNPPGLRMLHEGLVAETRTAWRGVNFGASFVAEKSWGPTNPGNSAVANDPGVIGALFLDRNTAIHAAGHSFFDRAFVGKIQASYRLPRAGIEIATVADYMDGLVFARQLLVTGLAQGPFLIPTTVRGSPEGGNRAEHVTNWSLRLQREFRVTLGRITASGDVLNLTNAGHSIQQNDLTGPSFNLRLPVAIQSPRTVRLGFRLEF